MRENPGGVGKQIKKKFLNLTGFKLKVKIFCSLQFGEKWKEMAHTKVISETKKKISTEISFTSFMREIPWNTSRMCKDLTRSVSKSRGNPRMSSRFPRGQAVRKSRRSFPWPWLTERQPELSQAVPSAQLSRERSQSIKVDVDKSRVEWLKGFYENFITFLPAATAFGSSSRTRQQECNYASFEITVFIILPLFPIILFPLFPSPCSTFLLMRFSLDETFISNSYFFYLIPNLYSFTLSVFLICYSGEFDRGIGESGSSNCSSALLRVCQSRESRLDQERGTA